MFRPNLVRLIPFLITLIVSVWSAPLVISADYEYYGHSPACPKNSAEMQFGLLSLFMPNEVTLRLTLEIDEKGGVKNVASSNAGDSLLVKFVQPELSKLVFEPARKSGTSIKSRLPVLAVINPRFRTTSVGFPVEQSHQITNSELYFDAIRELGVEPPALKRFPSYFCDLKVTDSLKRLPYTLLRLELDLDGKLLLSEIVDSKLPAFNLQIKSATLWSEFSPLRIDKKPQAGGCFLLVSFFPQVQYPAREYHLAEDSAAAWFDRWRVRLLPDTVGLMIPATPREYQFSEFALEKEYRTLSGDIFANLIVDTLGNILVRSTDTRKPEYHKAIRSALKNVKFFPATAFDGSSIEFRGSARFTFSINKSVRADFLWLDK